MPALSCNTAGKDHPRVCGEQIAREGAGEARAGSPPRVRGTGRIIYRCNSKHGITPACAGNRLILCAMVKFAWDHPRVCGEQCIKSAFRSCLQGSPPRVRGTESGAGMIGQENRITPACAGNSHQPAPSLRIPTDHPRVCGEQVAPWLEKILFKGSPPRVRGTARMNPFSLGRNWITPACAGNSHPLCQRHTQDQDHPRVCGEQVSEII